MTQRFLFPTWYTWHKICVIKSVEFFGSSTTSTASSTCEVLVVQRRVEYSRLLSVDLAYYSRVEYSGVIHSVKSRGFAFFISVQISSSLILYTEQKFTPLESEIKLNAFGVYFTVPSTQLCYILRYATLRYSTLIYRILLYPMLLYVKVLFSTILYCTVHYSTLLSSALLYSTLHYSTLLYNTLLYSTLLYSTLLYFTLCYSKPLNFTLCHFTRLCATLLYATLLYSTLLYFTRACIL